MTSKCPLCEGLGKRERFWLIEKKAVSNGQHLKLKPQPLTREQFDQYAAILPDCELDWRPGMMGWVQSGFNRCECNPAPEKPKARKRAKRPDERSTQQEFWWHR